MSHATQTNICHVLLAVQKDRLRQAAARLLEEHGWQIKAIEHSYDILYAVRQYTPGVLLLDLDMPLSDILSTIRILRRNPQTQHTQTLVACREQLDRQLLLELGNAGAAGIIVKPVTEKVLIEKISQCLALAAAAAKAPSDPREQSGAVQHVLGNPSLLRRRLACPLHDKPPEFWHYTLRSGKVGVDMTFFDIPSYTEAVPGATYVDYHLLAVAICPECLFASNNPDYFLQPGGREMRGPIFDPAPRQALIDAVEDRLKVRTGPLPHLFDEQRNFGEALVAYEAALLSSRQLHNCNQHHYAIELVRMGNYHLRLAQLLEKYPLAGSHAPVSPADTQWQIHDHYQQTADLLKHAYVYVQGPLFYRNTYQIIAVMLYLRQDSQAYQYLSRLKELEHQPSPDAQDRAALARYLQASQKAWEDRNYHRGPDS